MMRFDFPAAETDPVVDQVREDVRSFLEEDRKAGGFEPVCSGWMVVDEAFSRRCGEQGFIGVTWPKRYGGRELPWLARYVILEELLAAGAPAGAHWIADRQSGPQLLRFGAENLRQKILPGIARGEVFFSIGMSEPDAGSDLAAIRSRAERVEGGWRLNGRKVWTSGAHRAHYMIGLFRTSPAEGRNRHMGLTQFVVDLKSPGVECRPIEDMTGHADFNEVTLDDVFVADDHVLGEPGQGWQLVVSELAYERSGPERFLSAFPLLSQTVDLIGARTEKAEHKTFGRLISHISVLRAMSMSIAVKLADGSLPATEAALVKDLGGALEREIPEAMRAMPTPRPAAGKGGYAEFLGQTLLSAPSFTLRGGTPEILKGIIAKELGLR